MKFKKEIGGKFLEFETGTLATQASGSCLVKYGETVVLSTCQLGQERAEVDFFPLTCDYEERYYAAGRIGGSRFIRREGRPSTEAVLISRMIDRSIRPLFPEGFFHEVQVVNTCLSWDEKNDPAVLGVLGSSLSLLISEIPWQGPVAAVRVGQIDKEFIINPTYEQREKSEIDLVFAGQRKNGEILINMIEGGAIEASEEIFSQALEFALPFIAEILDFQEEIAAKIGREKISFERPALEKETENKWRNFIEDKIKQIFAERSKRERDKMRHDFLDEFVKYVEENEGAELTREAKIFFHQEEIRIIKEIVFKENRRIDGRAFDEIREIKAEVGILPRAHGSALFSRGETRILSILTLGSPSDQQLLEGMEIVGKKRFLHHYNFPPYSVGEVGRIGSPNRREIGHGMLAEKALLPVVPSFDEFPYTIRVVSEVVSSNGSTSMGSTCAASLSLMDAGVPVSKHVSGIAIGIIRSEAGDYKLLTDIQGPEDACGGMDFKVTGTEDGITAIQMDVKGEGITEKIYKEALQRAKQARSKILKIQKQTIAKPNKELSPFAPRVYSLEINPDKIGTVIGPGGKVINEIIEDCGVSIDIEESGKVFVTAEKKEAAEKAIKWIQNLTRELKVGEIFQGRVKRILDFGAIIEIVPGQEGLCHISQFVPYRINKVEDVVEVGQMIPVKIISIDAQKRINLSAKEAGFKPLKKKKK